MISARYRIDYPGEFVILESKWAAGKKQQTREWVDNPIENHHISGRAACIGSNIDRGLFDYAKLQKHRGGLLGSKKLQTYGTGQILKDMRLDFTVEFDKDMLNTLLDEKQHESNIIYTNTRLCITHPGCCYFVPYSPILLKETTLLYLAAFDGHSEIFLLGYTTETNAGNTSFESQVNSIMAAYNSTKFYVVGRPHQIPEQWLNNSNVSTFTYREFITYCDV